jgi:predicted metal-dependent phosphoesterase TrpH
VLNGASSPSANEAARELSERMELPGVAGSDAHQPSEVCTVYTAIKASLDVDEILRAIKKGSISVSPFGKSIRF